jgi:hypothetical protein
MLAIGDLRFEIKAHVVGMVALTGVAAVRSSIAMAASEWYPISERFKVP